ncbi:MAG: hypothetical protein WA421_11340 [Nitrososphaeraceae archaeon]
MNNTRNLTIAAILIAATLVVGVTFAATTQSAFAARKGDRNENGNTITEQKCKQYGIVSGFDNTAEQECQNVICTHPSSDGSCVSEGSATPKVKPTPPKDDGDEDKDQQHDDQNPHNDDQKKDDMSKYW